MKTHQFDIHFLCGRQNKAAVVAACAAILMVSACLPFDGVARAGLITVVDETFDGYTHFPDGKPDNDPVNLGVPTVAKGADSPYWLAARFESFDDHPISKDVGVQKFGGGGNNTPVGRAGDEAGLVLRLDLTGLTNVTLDFDWRTFLADSSDRFAVAYYVGDGTEFQAGGLGMPNGTYDWYNDPDLGGGVMDLDGGWPIRGTKTTGSKSCELLAVTRFRTSTSICRWKTVLSTSPSGWITATTTS